MLAMAEKRKTEQVNMRLSSKLLQRLDRIGAPYDLTRSELIRRAVEEYVERRDPQASAQVRVPHPNPRRPD